MEKGHQREETAEAGRAEEAPAQSPEGKNPKKQARLPRRTRKAGALGGSHGEGRKEQEAAEPQSPSPQPPAQDLGVHLVEKSSQGAPALGCGHRGKVSVLTWGPRALSPPWPSGRRTGAPIWRRYLAPENRCPVTDTARYDPLRPPPEEWGPSVAHHRALLAEHG